jgi:heptosyltransferase-2
VILAPGGAKNAQCDDALRRWPIEHYAALAKQLADHPVEIALTGAATDSWVEPHFQDIPHHNFIGKLPLLDLVTLLKQASLLITHDSGPLHLAKLVACPTIALFGPTNPYEKLSASENIHLFWEGGKLPCSPCYDGKNYARCSQNVCLSRITPEAVLRRALVAKKRESALP